MAKVDCTDYQKIVYRMAMNLASREENRDIDDVVAAIRRDFPVIPADMIVESIDAATRRGPQVTKELTKKLIRISREARTAVDLKTKTKDAVQRLQEGELPEEPKTKKLGPPTIEQARKTLANLRRWLETSDPAMAEKLKDKLDTLNQRIKSGDIVVAEGRDLQLHTELQSLQDQIDSARRKIFEEKTIKNLEQQIDTLQAHLDSGTLPEKSARPKRGTGLADRLRDIRDDLKKQLAQSEPARKVRLERTIELLEEKIESGDFAAAPKKAVPPMSKELRKLQNEAVRLRHEIMYQRNRMKTMTAWGRIVDLHSAIRTAMTTGEFSFIGRQGRLLGLSHPIAALTDALPKMLQSLKDGAVADEINADLYERDNYLLFAEAGGILSPIHLEEGGRMEEFAPGGFLDRVPLLRNYVQAFRRAGTVYLNVLRMDAFDSMMSTLTRTQEGTAEEAKELARYINHTTGRTGVLSGTGADIANMILFSAEYRLSRFQVLFGTPVKILTPDFITKNEWFKGKVHIDPVPLTVRYILAKELARTLVGYSVYYFLWWLAGGDMEFDPRSTEFGKIKLGNTVILDPLAGLSQALVVTARVFSGQKKTIGGRIVPVRETDEIALRYGGDDAWDIFARYVRSGLAPGPSMAFNLAAGRDVAGNRYQWMDALIQSPLPITYRDVYQIWQQEGLSEDMAATILAFLGEGVQVYNEKGKRR